VTRIHFYVYMRTGRRAAVSEHRTRTSLPRVRCATVTLTLCAC